MVPSPNPNTTCPFPLPYPLEDCTCPYPRAQNPRQMQGYPSLVGSLLLFMGEVGRQREKNQNILNWKRCLKFVPF
uniref:Uncharacterized protein n=1 Tax=Nelumbo nucifera TaxID=4432 RepID=A0A822YT38_NELNU|nr:TPA_asm: hypothetical protein HUJ06_007935 [Nelumbo nucifera]